MPTPVQTPTRAPPSFSYKDPPKQAFGAWKNLPDGRYNYTNGRWYGAPWPKYFWSPNTNMYEITGGKLYSWP